jgi:hypothetical protein
MMTADNNLALGFDMFQQFGAHFCKYFKTNDSTTSVWLKRRVQECEEQTTCGRRKTKTSK